LRLALKVALALFACAAPLALSEQAEAAPMDIAPERLVLQPMGLMGGDTCQSAAAGAKTYLSNGRYSPASFPTCGADNVAWKNIMNELGMVIAPTAFHPARTTGFGGFALTLEASYTSINANQATPGGVQYWHQGTEGPNNNQTNQSSIVNQSPDSIMQVYSLKARKGLPYGFEIVGSLGYVSNTSYWTGGADIRWAILEGFRTGFLGYLPDISVGGGVRTLTGSPKFFLTTVGIDAQISKQFAIAESAKLTPYVGFQHVLIYADSTLVDLTPNTNATQQCGYAGNASGPGGDGQPICRNTATTPTGATVPLNQDFNNNATFTKARLYRNRGIVGVNYRFEQLYVAGQFMIDVTDPSQNEDIVGGRQWTTVLEAGVFF
jgi:hypothetical protein